MSSAPPNPKLPAGVDLPSNRRHDGPCPACERSGGRVAYTVRGIPVHSNVLCDDAESARTYATGDLDLVCCEGCGLLFNPLHEERLAEYGPGYEETQGFSPTFVAWMEELVEQLVERYSLRKGRERRVLEIGCGKGEFLERLAARAECRGIGYDPTLSPDRTPDSQHLSFVARSWGAQDAGLEVDLVCCRHTLEHIKETARFLTLLRRNLGDGGAPVFFEVPDTLRILEEGAFWDVYYEHSTYFTPGSLARAFRWAGFEVEALELAYAGQYILLHARPSGNSTQAAAGTLEIEEDPGQVLTAVDRFRASVSESLSRWHGYFSDARAKQEDVVVWGSGSKGVGFLTTLGADAGVQRVVDVNPHKHGKFMAGTGQQIVSPESLQQAPPDRVVVMNPIYVGEIREMLEGMGLRPELCAV